MDGSMPTALSVYGRQYLLHRAAALAGLVGRDVVAPTTTPVLSPPPLRSALHATVAILASRRLAGDVQGGLNLAGRYQLKRRSPPNPYNRECRPHLIQPIFLLPSIS